MVETDDGVGLGLQGGEAPRSVAASPTATPASSDPSDAGCPPPVLPGERIDRAADEPRQAAAPAVPVFEPATFLALAAARGRVLESILGRISDVAGPTARTARQWCWTLDDKISAVDMCFTSSQLVADPGLYRDELVTLAALAVGAIEQHDADQAEAG